MKRSAPITASFVDIGGVLLANGWDHHARKRAARHFKPARAELEDRHQLNFDICEEGRLVLDVARPPAGQVVYIENTPMFVQVARGLGIRRICHADYKSTCAKLASLGLRN